MHKFANIMVREFKHVNKLQEDKILFEVGYNEKRGMKPPTEQQANLFDELMSTKSLPTFSFLDAEN